MTNYTVAAFDGTPGTNATTVDSYTIGNTSFTLQFLIRRPVAPASDVPWKFLTTLGYMWLQEIGSGFANIKEIRWDTHDSSFGNLAASNDHWIFYSYAYDMVAHTVTLLMSDVTDVGNSNNIDVTAYSVLNSVPAAPFGPFSSGTNPFNLGDNGFNFAGRIFGGAAYNTTHAIDDTTAKTDIMKIVNSTVSADSIYLFNGEGGQIEEYKTGHNLSPVGGITFPIITLTPPPTLVTITDSATATDSVSTLISGISITDFALATDSVISYKPTIITDFAYAEDNISINRGTTVICGTPSGAIPLTPMEKDYINLSYQQIIDMSGLPITYRIATIVGEDAYEHPIITYTDKTIVAFVTILRNDEYEYVEPGFLPNHYASMWVYCVTPQVGDHVVWQGIEWEVRNSIPKVIGGDTVYYQTILRRVLARLPLTGEPGDGTNLGDTTGTGGTLISGGVQYPPEGDP